MTDRPPPELPADVRAFLYSCIDAVEQVELLLHLRRSARPASVAALSAALGLADHATRHHVEILAARGLVQTTVEEEVRYRFAPRTPVLAGYVEQLAEVWSESRASVASFVASQPRRSLKRFADAFRLREPD